MALATQRAGVENTIVAVGTEEAQRRASEFVAPLEVDGVRILQFSTPTWPRERPDRWGLSAAYVRWILAHVTNFDLVHIHGAWGLGLISGLFAAHRAKKPVVVTPHESFTKCDIDDSPNRLRRTQKLALKRLYLRWASLFVITSELEAQDSIPPGLMHRVRIIHYPLVDGSAIPSAPQRSPGQTLRVGFLGRMHPKKNLDLLIEAVATLPDRVHLVVAGDGPEAARLQRLAKTRLGERVEWLGFVPPGRRAEFLNKVDLLAMPSVFESFGMSGAEAMLDGVPVLVSERTGLAEVIHRHGGGSVVQPTISSIARGIAELEGNNNLEQLGREGQQAVISELSFGKIGADLINAYEDALCPATTEATATAH